MPRNWSAQRPRSLLDMVIKDGTDVTRLVQMFRKRFFTLWIDSFRRHVPLLANFNSAEHSALSKSSVSWTRPSCSSPRSGANELRRRVEKMKTADPASPCACRRRCCGRRWPRNRSRWRYGSSCPTCPTCCHLVKPCIMMSPLSASQFIDPRRSGSMWLFSTRRRRFAPRTPSAASCAEAAPVVVGDSKQLPRPGSSRRTEGEEETDVQDLESILDECGTIGLPQKMLLWHYRSRNESLIAFSNAYYYDNRLYTFPSADLPGPPAASSSFMSRTASTTGAESGRTRSRRRRWPTWSSSSSRPIQRCRWGSSHSARNSSSPSLRWSSI